MIKACSSYLDLICPPDCQHCKEIEFTHFLLHSCSCLWRSFSSSVYILLPQLHAVHHFLPRVSTLQKKQSKLELLLGDFSAAADQLDKDPE